MAGGMMGWGRVAFCGCLALVFAGCVGRIEETPLPVSEVSTQKLTDAEWVARIDAVLDYTYLERHLNVRDHAAWQIMHGVLAYGPGFPLEVEGKVMGTVAHLQAGGAMQGWDVVPGRVIDEATGERGVSTLLQLGSKAGQGHVDQWLGYMAHAGLKLEDQFLIGGETFTVRGFLEQAKWEVPRNAQQEYSWTLMTLSQFESTEATWVAADGETWSVADLVQIEADYDLGFGPCGGCHRLTGLALICEKRRLEGLPFEGPWAKAKERLDAGVEAAREYQNADGSFSTNYLARGGATSDLAQILGTSGHVIEFLAIHLPDDRLREPWVERAVEQMASVFDKTRGFDLECGALYHAAHGLVLYRNRLARSAYQPPPGASGTVGESSTAGIEIPEAPANP